MRSLRDAVLGLRRVATGPGAGLWIATRHADPAIGCGTYEPNVQDAIMEDLHAGDVFYDIGANIGIFSLVAARRVGPSGRVHAFEPVKRNILALRHAIGRNQFNNIELSGVAVSSCSGVTRLNVARHIGGATLHGYGVPPDLSHQVPVTTIAIDDKIASCSWRPPTLVKIDVEGAELAVLQGMAATMTQHRPHLLIEIDDATAAGLAGKMAEVRAFVLDRGYAVSDLAPSYQHINWHVAHIRCYPP